MTGMTFYSFQQSLGSGEISTMKKIWRIIHAKQGMTLVSVNGVLCAMKLVI
jgi:hypothetical protein